MMYYLIAILGNFKMSLAVLSSFLFIWLLVIAISFADNCLRKEESVQMLADFKKVLRYFIITTMLLVFIPSQKQAAFIIVAPAIVENKDLQETVKNIPELTRLGTEYLKEILINEKEAVNK